MATLPAAATSSAQDPLTRDEWWDLFDELRLRQQDAYAKYGGPVAFFRAERNADPDIA